MWRRTGCVPDPLAIWDARRRARGGGRRGRSGTGPGALYAANAVAGPYSPDADAAGRRALQGAGARRS